MPMINKIPFAFHDKKRGQRLRQAHDRCARVQYVRQGRFRFLDPGSQNSYGSTTNTDEASQMFIGISQAFKKRSGDPVIGRSTNQAKAIAKW